MVKIPTNKALSTKNIVSRLFNFILKFYQKDLYKELYKILNIIVTNEDKFTQVNPKKKETGCLLPEKIWENIILLKKKNTQESIVLIKKIPLYEKTRYSIYLNLNRNDLRAFDTIFSFTVDSKNNIVNNNFNIYLIQDTDSFIKYLKVFRKSLISHLDNTKRQEWI